MDDPNVHQFRKSTGRARLRRLARAMPVVRVWQAVQGILNVQSGCDACGLDFAFADSGDSPAVFTSLIAGAVVLGLVIWTEVAYEPPIWIEMAIFLPLAAVVCLGTLRPLKVILIACNMATGPSKGGSNYDPYAAQYMAAVRLNGTASIPEQDGCSCLAIFHGPRGEIAIMEEYATGARRYYENCLFLSHATKRCRSGPGFCWCIN